MQNTDHAATRTISLNATIERHLNVNVKRMRIILLAAMCVVVLYTAYEDK